MINLHVAQIMKSTFTKEREDTVQKGCNLTTKISGLSGLNAFTSDKFSCCSNYEIHLQKGMCIFF